MPPPDFLHDTAADIARAVALLRAGELVALPTETVYGLAADALNEAAVRRIFEAKGRPLLDPLIVHVGDLSDIEKLAEVPPELAELAEKFWPGPLTVVLKKKDIVPALVTAGQPTVAIRFPAHPLMRRVLDSFGGVLAAPSANPFGYISPTEARHVRDSLGEKVPWILDGGACRHGLESTIVHLGDPARPRLLRPGPVSREALEDALGRPVLAGVEKADDTAAQVAPGMLSRHYSPRTSVILRAKGAAPLLPENGASAQTAVIWLARPLVPTPGATDFWLSEDGDLPTAARNVFALLRRLDIVGFAAIHAELADGTGLGTAINDRLRRAAAK